MRGLETRRVFELRYSVECRKLRFVPGCPLFCCPRFCSLRVSTSNGRMPPRSEFASENSGYIGMASLVQHTRDCIKFLGEPFEDVNRWIDECFAHYGPLHRRYRHHREGIEEVRDRFGDRGAVAAAIHILRDCRHLPRKGDYELGYVDALGLKRDWSTAAYIKYSEGDFESLVEQLLRPTGLLLWSFIDLSLLQPLLSSLTRLDHKDIEALIPEWKKATAKRESLSSLKPGDPSVFVADTVRPPVTEYLKVVEESAFFKALSSVNEVSFAFIAIDKLVNPLVYLDYEYLDTLKPELTSTDDLDVVRFAMPQTLASQVKAGIDPTRHNVIFVSNEKSMTVSPVQLRQTPEGTEVKFIVAANFNMLLVSNHSGRLLIRNGIHRAFLLAQMGVKVVPCILVKERGSIQSLQITSYPAFAPSVLTLPRPPMLTDFLDPELCLQVPLQRTHKVIRISAEELIIPVD